MVGSVPGPLGEWKLKLWLSYSCEHSKASAAVEKNTPGKTSVEILAMTGINYAGCHATVKAAFLGECDPWRQM